MKYLLILLFSFLLSCDYYEEYFNDTEMIPIGSKSILITSPIHDVEDVFLNEGFSIFTKENHDETNIVKIKDLGYFKCEIKNLGNFTQLKVLYNKNNPDSLEYLKYTEDNTKMIYNQVIQTLNESGIDNIYYENMR